MTDRSDVEALLDATQIALRSGGVEAAMAAMGRPDAATLRRLQDKARRNERLLSAAARGVAAARRRARDLSDEGRFSTYGADGRRDQVGLAAGLPARRL
jgi:hypothetical protein